MRGWDIRRRLLLLALLPAALIALVLALYFTHARIDDLNRSLRGHGARIAANLAPACEYGVISGNYALLDPLLRNLTASPEVRAVIVYDARQRRLVERRGGEQSHRNGLLEHFVAWYSGLPEVLEFQAPIRQVELPLESFGEAEGEAAGAREREVGWVKVELASHPTLARQAAVVVNGLTIALLGLLLAAALAVRAGRDVSRPILELTRVVRRLGEGELSARVAVRERGGNRELTALGGGINAMADALENSHDRMRHHIDQATRELRETLEAVEVQNVELDIARKRALEASRVKSEFLSSMSHEIRTPMNGVIGFSNLLLHTPLNEVQREYVQTISESASNLLTIINDILDFSKVESGQLTLEAVPYDLREVIDEALVLLAPLAYEKGLELVELIYSDVPTRLIGDPVRIRQVITNLVGNAIKFTADGSVVVRVMLEGEEEGQVLLRVTVSDTGCGIPTDRRKGLFDAFSQVDASVTRRFGGTGLGLAISKRLVQHMLGDIGVDSREGVGSTFWFTLRAERQRTREVDDVSEPPAARGQVVLHDPHLLARVALGHRLSGWGYRVIEADGLDAVGGRLRGEGIEVVICGMGSDERRVEEIADWLGRWRRLSPRLRVAVLVNSIDQRLHDRLLAVGVDGVLPKMSRHDTLAREVERLFEPEPSAGGRARNAPPLAPPTEDEEAEAGSFEGLRVLVVDDNSINLLLTTTLLRNKGVDVVQAAGGEEAVERATRRSFDMILMDIHMPGVSGIEATRRIRAGEPEGERTPIIALTAHALPGERERFLEAGMDACLVKPLQVEELWGTVRRWTRREGGGGGAVTAAVVEDGERPIYDGALALKLAGGNRELADRLIGMLLRDLGERRESIRAAFERGDDEELVERVHKLHGSSAHCGTPALRHAAAVLESRLVEGGEVAVETLVGALEAEVERLVAWGESRAVES